MKAQKTHSKNVAVVILFCAMFAVCSSPSVGQVVNGRLITSIYTWKQYDTVNVSKTFARGFQSVILDVTQDQFSLHGHFQGAVMLQKKLDELPDYRLYYGYAQWKDIGGVVDLSFGRIPFFAGVGSGTVDGALTRVHVANNALRVTLYGGANTPVDMTVRKWGPLKNDFTLGGQLLGTIDDVRLGFSYVNRQRQRPGYWALRSDTLFNPVSLYVDPEQAKEQYASLDASYSFLNGSFHGRYDHNIDFRKVQRAQFGLKYYPSDEWAVSAEYIHRVPRLPFNSFFAVFSLPTSDEMEAGIDYTVKSGTRLFVRGAYVQYVDDRSFRYTVGVAHDHASASYRGSTGYAGELNSVTLQGAYPFFDRMLIPTIGMSFTSYKLNAIDNTEQTIAATVGLIARPLQMLSVDVQGQWLNNKVYRNDVRVYAGLNFWFAEHLRLFE